MIDYWQGVCPVTGVDQIEILRASHIKPWSESDDRERLDPFNGFLLAANVDVLFDNHLISFDETGLLIKANRLPAVTLQKLGLTEDMLPIKITDRHETYLQMHRQKMSKLDQPSEP